MKKAEFSLLFFPQDTRENLMERIKFNTTNIKIS